MTRLISIASLLLAGSVFAQSFDGTGPAIRSNDDAALAVTWLEPARADLRTESLVADPSLLPDSRHAESEPVQFAWSLDSEPGAAPGARVTSKQYWVDATGAELDAGLKLPISAPAAVIRVSALDAGAAVRIRPERIRIAVDGKPIGQGESVLRSIADGDALRQQGMAVPPQSIAFRLDRGVPVGMLEMKIDGIAAEQPLVVHVFEPDSAWTGELSLPRHDHLSGERLVFDLALRAGGKSAVIDSVQAVLVDPHADRSWPLELGRGGSTLTGTAPSGRVVSGREGLYEAHVYVQTEIDGTIVRRDLKLPVGVAPPVARLTGSASAHRADGLEIDLGVEAAAPGRYQVNGRVFGTAPDGSMAPLAMAQSAATIAGGTGLLTLRVEPGLLGARGLRAPYEVRGLELLDQGRMFLLHRQDRALVLSPR